MTGVWERNVTGRGVTVVVVDDGVEHTVQDIAPNYVSAQEPLPSRPQPTACFLLQPQPIPLQIWGWEMGGLSSLLPPANTADMSLRHGRWLQSPHW